MNPEKLFRLIQATAETDDPVTLLQAAGKDHVPVEPSAVPAMFAETPKTARMPVPDSQDRQTIDVVLAEISEQEWYKEQIAARKVFEAREGQTGADDMLSCIASQL